MATDPTVDFPEIKNVGDILDQMPLKPVPSIFEPPAVKLGVYRAISEITEALGKEGIAKEKQVTEGAKFKYRGIDQVYAALNPLLAKHGLVILPRVLDRSFIERTSARGNALFYTTLTVAFDFVSVADGSRHTVVTVGEAMDSGDKSSNKCLSVALKYAAFMVFCIPVEGEDDDPDATVHEVAPKGQPVAPRQQEPQETDEDRRKRLETEARNNYNDAEAWLRACTNVADLKRTFESSIKWDRIPKGWHPRLVAVEKEILAQIKAAEAAPRGNVAPKFDDIADDLPF